MDIARDAAEALTDDGGAAQGLIPHARRSGRPRSLRRAWLAGGLLLSAAVVMAAIAASTRRPLASSARKSFGARHIQQQVLVDTCSGPGENCHGSRCCRTPGMQCYEKAPGLARCRGECHAGPDPTDEDPAPWSCRALGRRAPGAAGCAASGGDCAASHCCRTTGFQCYQKNATAAKCRARCSPGVDFTDEDSNPWSCKKLGARTPGRAAWVTAPGSKCAKTSYDDCHETKCCGVAGMQCFAQNPYYATCNKECPTGWDCGKLGFRTPPSAEEAARGSREPTGLGPWVAKECAQAGQNCSQAKCCADPGLQCFAKGGNWSACKSKCTGFPEPTHRHAAGWECDRLGPRTPGPYLPSLFCFAVFMAESYEATLIKAQLMRAVGIFACDGYALLSSGNETWKVGDAPWGAVEVQPFEAAEVGRSRDGTAGNAKLFMNAWERVKLDKSWGYYDFIVKVDPDALIVPQRLRTHLSQFIGQNVYIINCHKPNGMKPMMFGSVEAVSKAALAGYFEHRDRCVRELEWRTWGEDLFLGKCLQKLGTKGAQNLDMVSDGVCMGVDCTDRKAAGFHPLKNLTSWLKCLDTIEGS